MKTAAATRFQHTRLRWLSFAALALLNVGCMKRTGYVIDPSHTEAKREQIDGHWFLREVNESGKLTSVELVYCPILPGQPVVCRTSVVWERENRALIDHPKLARPAALVR